MSLNLVLKISVMLFSLLIGGACQASKGSGSGQRILDLLGAIEKEFDGASSQQEKFEIVSRPMDKEKLWKFEGTHDLLEREGKPSTQKTNPLALAIVVADTNKLEKFLRCVENINDDRLAVWGYRQPYTLAHLALDPTHPLGCVDWVGDVPLGKRLKVVDLLAQKKANFNHIIPKHPYLNPPLAAGIPEGRPFKHYQALQARALLYGADPKIKGSCFDSWQMDLDCLIDMAFDQMRQEKIQPTPCEGVKTRFTELRRKALEDLQAQINALNALTF